MNDFQDVLKLVIESDDALARPRLDHLGGNLDKTDDPREALQVWAKAHAQEFNVLKQRANKAIEMLKHLYNTLGEFDKTTVAAATGGARPSAPAPTQGGLSPEMKAQLAAAQAQYQAARRPQAQPQTPPAGEAK